MSDTADEPQTEAQPGPDPSNTPNPECLTAPVDEDDDVYDLVAGLQPDQDEEQPRP